MSRRYASVPTSRWDRAGEFRKLPRDAQWLFGLLETQPEISACGSIPLRVRRWAAMAADCTEQVVWCALKSLDSAGLVVVDEDTEEVLIRPFTRQDGGYSNPRRLPSIRDAANSIESPAIVRALAAEFDQLEIGAMWRGQASIDSLSIGIPEGDYAEVEQPALPPGAAPDSTDANSVPHAETSQVNSLTTGYDESTDCLTDARRRVPQPTTHNPQPEGSNEPSSFGSPNSPDKTATKAKRGTRIPTDFHATPPMIEWARINTPLVGVTDTQAFVDHWTAETGSRSTKCDWVAAWRNWMRKAQRDAEIVKRREERYAAPRQQPASDAPKNIPRSQRCPTHPAFPAHNCGPCRSERTSRDDR
jgi:hypothetical protein